MNFDDAIEGSYNDLYAHACERWLEVIISTEPADRPRAEEVSTQMAQLSGIRIERCIWVNNPDDGEKLQNSYWGLLGTSFTDDSIRWMRSYFFSKLLPPGLSRSKHLLMIDKKRAIDYGQLATMSLHGERFWPELSKLISCHIAAAESAFLSWIAPGTIILMERPSQITVVDNVVTDITWRDS